MRWSWLILVAGLLAAGAALSWIDALALNPLLHPLLHPVPPHAIGPHGLGPGRPRSAMRTGLWPWPVLGLRRADQFGYGWVLSTAAVLALVGFAAAALVPQRVRVAVERMESPGGLLTVLVAGVVGALLVAASTLLLRYTLALAALAPFIWFLAVAALALGTAALGVYTARRLRGRFGPAHPLLTTAAGVLLVVDLSLVPYAGWAAGALAGLAALGVSAVTRLGSATGWTIDALDWPANQS